MEHRARFWAGVVGESGGVGLEQIVHRGRINQVEHPAFAARCGALHFLAGRFLGNGVNDPTWLRRPRRRVRRRGVAATRGRSPIHFTYCGNFVRQFNAFSIGRIRDQRLRGSTVEFLFQLFTGGEIVSLHHDARIRVLIGDLRAAETPAGAGGHVHAHAQPVRLAHGPTHHLHPLRRKIIDVFILKPFRAVNRDDVDAAEAGGGVAFEFLREIRLVHGAAHPPVEGPRLLLRGDGRPRERIIGGGGEGGQQQRSQRQQKSAGKVHALINANFVFRRKRRV